MNTIIKSYYFNTSNPTELAAYKELAEMLTSRGSKCFETWNGKGSHYDVFFKDGVMVELETDFLTDNQWNTAAIPGKSENGLRVFDWAQDYPINFRKSIKRGHYLELTAEMRDVRRNTHKCGYCGKMEPAAKGNVFCPHCIDSQYLDVATLHLTRMMPADFTGKREELSAAETAHLLPIFKDAQLHGNTASGKARIAKERAGLIKQRDAAIRKAETKFTGLTWLMDKGIPTDNVIYYDHSDKFSFGWHKPIEALFLSELLELISEFPFCYEIKTADGRTI